MKKNKLFESEINEFVAGKSVVNCLRNRKARKVMAESVSEEMSLIDMFDERFKYRSDLREIANDTTKEAYMIIRKEFGDSMWRQLGMDDCDERGLIDALNWMQEMYGITNAQDLADVQLGRKSVKNFKKTEEQEEEKTKLSKSELEDLAFRLADYLCESFIILEDQDEQYADLLAAVEKILEEDVPNPESMRDCYNWCDRWYKKIEGLTYSYYNDPNPLSYYEEQEEDQVEDIGEPWEIHYPTEKELKEIARLEKVTVDDIFETEICDHYMSALETGDYSGLDEQDERLLDEWCLKYRYLWTLTQNDGEFPEASFGECDVCGMAGNVVPVLCIQRKRKEEQEQFSISKKRGYSISDVYPDSRWGEKERLNGPNGMSKVERDMLLKFETVVPKLVKKAMNKVKGHSDPETIKKMVLGMIKRGDLFSKIGGKVGAEWNELSAGFRRELINLIKDTFAEYNKQA